MNGGNNFLELYKEMHNTIRETSKREWETVKFYTTIFLALLAATATLIVYSKSISSIIPKIFILILPSYMLIISIIGLRNYKRECRRIWERMASIAKIEEKLSFRIPRDKNCEVFKDDKFYIPKDHIEIDKKINGEKTTENFVNQLLKWRSPLARPSGSSYSNHLLLFVSYMGISIFLIILLIISILIPL
jgi:hypothetical protein